MDGKCYTVSAEGGLEAGIAVADRFADHVLLGGKGDSRQIWLGSGRAESIPEIRDGRIVDTVRYAQYRAGVDKLDSFRLVRRSREKEVIVRVTAGKLFFERKPFVERPRLRSGAFGVTDTTAFTHAGSILYPQDRDQLFALRDGDAIVIVDLIGAALTLRMSGTTPSISEAGPKDVIEGISRIASRARTVPGLIENLGILAQLGVSEQQRRRIGDGSPIRAKQMAGHA